MIIDKFRKAIIDKNLLNYDDTVIVGASGGPDSQFLIYMLKELEIEYNLEIILAHLNHLHRDEAIYDENLVIKTANDLNLKYYIEHESMDEYAKINKISPEDAGRRLRYGFFNEIKKNHPNSKIAVAHIKDDQAETILMRIIRGTGIDGLLAMDYKTNDIIRPMIDIKKKEILEYLDDNKIIYAIDKTNLETDYTRNYIRHEIIPKIEVLNPSFIDNITSLSALAREDISIIDESVDEKFDELVKKVTNDYIIFDRDKLSNISKPILSRIIRKSIAIIKGDIKDISKANIEEFLSLIDLDTGRKIEIGNLCFIKNYNDYYFGFIKNDKKNERYYPLELDRLNIFDDHKINLKLLKGRENIDKKNKKIAYFDYDKLSFPLTIRYRKNGDKFKPIGFKHSKKLKDYFIDEKVDRSLRDLIPIILSDEEIIWIVGYRQSEEYKVYEDTKNILKIEVVDGN